MIRPLLIWAVLVMCAATGSAEMNLVAERGRFKEFDVVIEEYPDTRKPGLLKIFQNDRLVYEEEGYHYSLKNDPRYNFPKMGEDITGDGVPDLAVLHFSGGAHCCYSVSIFALEYPFRLIDWIEAGHGWLGFRDPDRDGIREIAVLDHTFAYWNASYASSPAPKVILRFQNGRYVPAYDLMREPLEDVEPPSVAADWQLKDCGSIDGWQHEGYCLDAAVWGHMLDLIYAGHEQAAWAYFEGAWDAGPDTKERFKEAFIAELNSSPWAPRLGEPDE